MSMIKVREFHGEVQYGRLIAIGPPFFRINPKVVCKCYCGVVFVTTLSCVRSGKTKSCGCMGSPGRYRHGLSKTSEYESWVGMIKRCTYVNCKAYKNYGGRGIRVVDEWVGPGGFDRFIEHVGMKPSKEHSIDRIDNNDDYRPGNVRWATRVEQARNRRLSNVEKQGAVIYKNTSYTIVGFSRLLGIPRSVVADRIRLGWDAERIASTPFTPRKVSLICQKH